MLRKKRTTLKSRKIYKINNTVYQSHTLYTFHLECEKAMQDGVIKSFVIPESLGTKSRYTTYKPIIDSITFDSLMEGRYYIELCYKLQRSEIKGFERQVAFLLQPAFKKNGVSYKKIEYICDFLVESNDGDKNVIDIKGKETPEFKIKHKLFEYKFPEYTLTCLQYYEPQNSWLDLKEIKKLTRKKVKK